MLADENFRQCIHTTALPESPRIVVFSAHPSARLNYTCKFIFNHVLNCAVELTNNAAKFKSETGIKINYSEYVIENCFSIQPYGLLTETQVSETKPMQFTYAEQIYFFKTESDTQNLFFDIFSAVFYFISRYEEWQKFKADQHGRFEATSSLLVQHNSHLLPVVDSWINELRISLQNYYPEQKLPVKQFKIISTIDLDNLYAYKAKGLIRLIGGSVKDSLRGDFESFKLRLNVLVGRKKDPFDVYEEVSVFCKENKIPLVYFFLFKTGTTYDRTLNPASKAYHQVFEILSRHSASFGLHPSYNSAYEPALLEDEVKRLHQSSGKKITLSRQHYLRFDIRTTPNLLSKQGIEVDFSMGFASSPGFRAGTSHPFYYYDFNQEVEGQLLFMPFCAMDGAFVVYNKKNTEETFNTLFNLANDIKKNGGYFTTVYHERTFSDHLYHGFGTLYKKLHLHVKALSEDKN
jgi:hypothetical protein